MSSMTALHTSKSSNEITNLIKLFEELHKSAQPASTPPSKVNALMNSPLPSSRRQSPAATLSPQTTDRNMPVVKPRGGDAISRTVLSGARVANDGDASSSRSLPAPVVLQLKKVSTLQTISSSHLERTQPPVGKTGKRVAELRAMFEKPVLAADSPGTRTSSRNQVAQSRPRAQTLQRVHLSQAEGKQGWSSTLPLQKAIASQVEHSTPSVPTLGERAMDWVRHMTMNDDPNGMADALASGEATDPRSRVLLVALGSAIASLKCGMQNTFDNFVCFDSADDRARQGKLFDAAATRARSGLEHCLSGSHQRTGRGNDLDAMKIFEFACGKLRTMFGADNTNIIASESSIATEVIEKLVTAYREMMVTHCAGQKEAADLGAIHARARQHCERLFDGSLDFSGKTSDTHTRGSTRLQNALDAEFHMLQAQRSRAG